jgi:sortase A
LRNVRRDDAILVTTLYGHYQYSVVSTRIVQPDDLSVIGNAGEPILTLITCYPFSFVGSAPQRFIVQARPAVKVSPPGLTVVPEHVLPTSTSRLTRSSASHAWR